MKRVRFQLEAPAARTVLLAGDFTDWDASPRKMRRASADSHTFVAWVPLPPGTHEYRFIVDGQWMEDPEAESTPNPYGGLNSVCRISS